MGAPADKIIMVNKKSARSGRTSASVVVGCRPVRGSRASVCTRSYPDVLQPCRGVFLRRRRRNAGRRLKMAAKVQAQRPNVGLGSGRLSPRAGLSSLRGVERTKHSEAPVKISQPFVQSHNNYSIFSLCPHICDIGCVAENHSQAVKPHGTAGTLRQSAVKSCVKLRWFRVGVHSL